MLELYNETEQQRGLEQILLDEENKSALKLVDTNGKRITMEQVFVCVLKEQLYCILVPLNKIEGILSGTGFVFQVTSDTLRLVNDEKTSALVFNEYYLALRLTEQKKGA